MTLYLGFAFSKSKQVTEEVLTAGGKGFAGQLKQGFVLAPQ